MAKYRPPSSPECNPLDYTIEAYLQARVNKTRHPNRDALVTVLRQEWRKIPTAKIKDWCSSFRPRLEAVIKNKGMN